MYFIITQRAKIDKSFRIADKKKIEKKKKSKRTAFATKSVVDSIQSVPSRWEWKKKQTKHIVNLCPFIILMRIFSTKFRLFLVVLHFQSVKTNESN